MLKKNEDQLFLSYAKEVREVFCMSMGGGGGNQSKPFRIFIALLSTSNKKNEEKFARKLSENF